MIKLLTKSKRLLIWFLIVSGLYTASTLYGYRLLDIVSSDKPETYHEDGVYGSQHK